MHVPLSFGAVVMMIIGVTNRADMLMQRMLTIDKCIKRVFRHSGLSPLEVKSQSVTFICKPAGPLKPHMTATGA